LLRRLPKVLLAASALTAGLLAPVASTAVADIAPPWCGTPEPDAAENLPDGTEAGDPPGSYPHIPYYAIACTLERIQSESVADRMTVDVMGRSVEGRDMFSVVINALETPQQRRDFANWDKARNLMMSDPTAAQERVESAGSNIKVPVYIQAAIHGNEYQSVDATMQLIETLATTPRGVDAELDAILDNVIVVINPIQNPDGRVAGTRANANGFDMNRDYLTQSQPETRHSIELLQKWLPPEMIDMHGYLTPLLNGGATKPHNPSIEYDLHLKWNRARVAANGEALAEAGFGMQIPSEHWCSSDRLPPSSGVCPDGDLPGPAEAEGWDDWGPFYGPMYAQHVGLNASTVEMCQSTDPADACGGRAGARDQQYVVGMSTLTFAAANGPEMLIDMLEVYERAVANAPRPECCPAPYDVDNNWMLEFPEAYMLPAKGDLQRSQAEVARLIDWMLFNQIEVRRLTAPYTVGGTTYQAGDYFVPMAQVRRGLADTALRIGVDISERIERLYAPPGAWSHGYLWGADVYPVERGTTFEPASRRVFSTPTSLGGGIEAGYADYYAMEVDSPAAVRFMNGVLEDGWQPQVALEEFEGETRTLAAGSMIFPATPASKSALGKLSNKTGLEFRRVREENLPPTETVDRVPRIAVLTAGNTQELWSLRNLGFPADAVPTAAINTAASDPLADYDVVFNMGAWPGTNQPTARERLAAFFANGGGYIGTGTNGAGFLTASGQVSGLTAANRSGNGRSGIVYWDNTGGEDSIITGTYPDRDTAIMDPPTWFTAVPDSFSVDGRLPQSDFFAAGLWRIEGDPQSASAAGSAVIAHGTNTAGTSRMTVFAMNPLYRADPEREWPMVAAAAYWADQD
jgi:hypothetical protein